jgi:hypothetical protein
MKSANLASSGECSGSSQHERCYFFQILVSEHAYGNAVAEFGVDAHPPGLDNRRRIRGAQRHNEVVGKAQVLLRFVVRLRTFHPACESPCVFDAGDVGSQLLTNYSDQGTMISGIGSIRDFLCASRSGFGMEKEQL